MLEQGRCWPLPIGPTFTDEPPGGRVPHRRDGPRDLLGARTVHPRRAVPTADPVALGTAPRPIRRAGPQRCRRDPAVSAGTGPPSSVAVPVPPRTGPGMSGWTPPRGSPWTSPWTSRSSCRLGVPATPTLGSTRPWSPAARTAPGSIVWITAPAPVLGSDLLPTTPGRAVPVSLFSSAPAQVNNPAWSPPAVQTVLGRSYPGLALVRTRPGPGVGSSWTGALTWDHGTATEATVDAGGPS